MRADQKGQINRDFKIVIIDIRKIPFFILYYTHFEITGGPCNLIGSNWCDLLTNRTFFALNRIIFPANDEATMKTKQPIRFQGLFKVTNVIAGK